jgi:hypothetical protein
MSDIITKLYLNIDRFNYQGGDINISKDDIEMLNTAWWSLKYKPAIFLLGSILISRNRTRLWNYIKDTTRGERVITATSDYKANFAPVIEKPFRVDTNNTIEQTYSKIELINTSSRKSRRSREKLEEEKVVLPRRNPTFSEEYFKNSNVLTKNVKEMRLKNTLIRLFKTDRESFINRSERYFMKTKMIYIPFIIVFMIYFYDFSVISLGLYLKYQPLIDQYYLTNFK